MTTQTEPTLQPTARRRGGTGRRHQARTGWAFMAPFAVLFVLVFLIPILVSVRSAFFVKAPTGGGLYGGGELVEQFAGLQNFAWVLTNGQFWAGIGRVGLYTLLQVPVMIGLALVLALLLDSVFVKRVGALRLSYFLPFAIPGIIAAMIWLYMYTPELSPFMDYLPEGANFFSPGFILASMANMTTWTYTGYNMLIFLAALQAIPHELYEAARIDGASELRIATRIKVPMVAGASLLAVLLSIIGTIQLFNEPVIMETVNPWMGKDYTPMMMAYNTMMGTLSPSGAGPASAVSLMMAVIAGAIAVVYTLVQRRVTR